MESSGSPSASERRWLVMPVVCTICLIIAVFVGCLRTGQIWWLNHSNVSALPVYVRKPLQAGCSRQCIKWVLRISYSVGLVAGASGLIDSLRRFYVHRDLAGDASCVFLVFPIATYTLLVLSFGLIVLGRLCRFRDRLAAEQAYRACKQNAGISFLAGLTAGITQEVLCGFDDKEFPMPDAWRESCQMLGGSCGLICISLFVAQADAVEKREMQEPSDAEAPKIEETPQRQVSATGFIQGDPFCPRDLLSSRLQWTAPEPPDANWAPLDEDSTTDTRLEGMTEPLLRSDWSRADSETGSAPGTDRDRRQSDGKDGGKVEREQHAKRDAGTRETREVFHTPAGGQGHRRDFGSPFWRSPEPRESQWALPAMQQVVTAV